MNTNTFELDTPVLFLVFNRMDTTKKVFESIRKAKPPKLYLASDGARKHKVNEAQIVKEVRDYLISNIDWECNLKTLFRDENLGCKRAVSEAITWFFENEENGIILEDDCLPSQSFFQFCETLLIKYKDDLRVWNIGGYKYPGLEGDQFSYTFSRYPHIWGWATWANRWNKYDVEIKKYKENRNILFDYEYYVQNHENNHGKTVLDNVVAGNVDTWDYQWGFTLRTNNGLSIRPKENLISNIGFGSEEATHTKNRNQEIEMNLANEISFPLKHPDFVMIYNLDDYLYQRKYRDFRFVTKLKKKILGIFK